MTDIRFVYVTTKDTDQARGIARELIDRKLIACANILPQMESIYRWNGKIQEDKEAVLILKTLAKHVPEVTKAIERLHSYETPCALSFAIEDGSKGYMDWLRSEAP